MSPLALWNALIRTHHITSRTKVAKLRASASNCQIYALLRSGGCPGIMYVEGSETGVKDWVSSVQRLRYKDFQVERKAAEKQVETTRVEGGSGEKEYGLGKVEEVGSVKEFGVRMAELGVRKWWRQGMGYVQR